MWRSCGDVSRKSLALTRNKTQRKVQRQRRLCRGIAKGVFIASKALLAVCFQSVQRGGDRALVVVCGGRAVVYHGNYLR